MIDVFVHVGRQPHTSKRNALRAPPGRARCARPRGGTARRRSPRSRSSSAATGAPGVRRGDGEPGAAPSVMASPWLIHTICSRRAGRRAAPTRRVGTRQHGAAVLAAAGAAHLAAEVLRDELRAVADAEDRNAGVVDRGVDRRRVVDVHRRGAAREDDRPSAASPASPPTASCAARSRSRRAPRGRAGRSAARTARRSRRPGRCRAGRHAPRV